MAYKPTGRPNGRPRKDAVVARIKELAGLGAPPSVIAALVRIPEKELNERHKENMAIGRAEGVEKVLRALYGRVAEGGQKNTIETLFWVKCNAEWAETAAGRKGVAQEKGSDDMTGLTLEFVGADDPPAPALKALRGGKKG